MANFAIIVPSYNCEDYVAATMKSLLLQGDDLKRCHSVILTDDCSRDHTIEVAEATWNGPIPLVVFAADCNQGEYKNMNECIARLPEGIEWFLVMHADNLAKPGWLGTLLDHAESAPPRVASICTSWDNLAENGTISEGENREPPNVEYINGNDASVLGTLRRGCWWHISSCVTRVQAYREIGGLPLGLRLKGDWDFLLRLLAAGWDIAYIPRALMTYRANATGSSSVTFRQHKDIYETLTVLKRHQLVMTPWEINRYHLWNFWVLARRLVGSMIRGRWERGLKTMPTAGFVLSSWYRCLVRQWLGRRRFEWVSSTDPAAQSRLGQLSAAMSRFYSQQTTRKVYQAMIDAPESAQPAMEAALRSAILRDKRETVLEVGCGSGRIYERLRCEGLRARYTGIEIADYVIADNRARFPEAEWITGSGYALPVAPESQDCIFAYYVLEHCVYPERFLNGMLAALKPGGRLLLTFPDMIASGIFGSQALGWDRSTAKDHLRGGHLIHAVVRLWDTRVRLPRAMQRATRSVGHFPVNLLPQCLETGIEPQPDYDAVYLVTRREVEEWASARGHRVGYPAGQLELSPDALIEIVK